jgi:hypothetical protein
MSNLPIVYFVIAYGPRDSLVDSYYRIGHGKYRDSRQNKEWVFIGMEEQIVDASTEGAHSRFPLETAGGYTFVTLAYEADMPKNT